ncbi:TetR/AcrR family transcriptional regulator [Cellulomonas sp. McL0617]|uniref:TetR/AcrR family transcriptional regulator n=1 Tax=Cellulomonas sp. McL0617 TaxID=3415675 RepID=UPI003CF67E79
MTVSHDRAMTRRGTYPKGVAKREELLNTALEVIAREGYSRASLRQLAAAVELTQTGLLHHFESKEALFIEVLRRRDSAAEKLYRQALDEDPTLDFAEMLAEGVTGNTDVAGLMQLYARLAAEATEPDHPAREFFQNRRRALVAAYSEQIHGLQEADAVPTQHDPTMLALLTAALMDGLQSAWLVDPDIDMAAAMRAFWALVECRPE